MQLYKQFWYKHKTTKNRYVACCLKIEAFAYIDFLTCFIKNFFHSWELWIQSAQPTYRTI